MTQIGIPAEPEQVRQQLEQIIETILQQIPAGVVIAAAPSGETLLVNAYAKQLTGFDFETSVEIERYHEIQTFRGLHPDGRPYKAEEWPLSRAVRYGETVTNEEIELLRADGSPIIIQVNATPIRNAEGQIVAGVTAFVDITARKRAEQALYTTRIETEKLGERLSLLIEASSILIASTDYETALAHLVHLIVPRLADWCVVDAIGQDGCLHRLAVVHRDPSKSDLVERLKRRYPVLELQREHTITKTLNRGHSWFDPEVSSSRLAAEARDPEHLKLLQDLGFASEMVVPLVARGQTLGTLTFVRTSEERRYKAEDLLLAEELARRAAIVVDNVRLYEAERAARAEAEANQQRLALLAEMRERNRMAQELHDTVAQALGYLNLKIAVISSTLDQDGIDTAKANLQELKQVVAETYTDVREEIFNLRAKVMAGMHFMEVVERYIDKYRRFYNLDIQCIREADPALFDFPPEVTTQLVRTIQEALINIRKHARVQTATLRFGQENGSLCISIEDQGQGFDPEQAKEKTSSFGLQIMRERIESIGWRLELVTAPGQGTRIILRYQA